MKYGQRLKKGKHSMEKTIVKLEYCLPLLSAKIKDAVMNISDMERIRIQEIRLRLNRYLTAVLFGKEYFVTPSGRLMNAPTGSVEIAAEDIEFTFRQAFQNSIHSFHREVTQGFITCTGGNRVGFCGTAVLSQDRELSVENVKYISSLNIRIAREVRGCSSEIYERAFCEGISSLIIAGAPASGKTTVLRDLCSRLGARYRISLIDERNELSATVNGRAGSDVGILTDVFDSYSRYDGIMTAVRVMSPEILVCDEIGSKDDLKALEYALNSGVKLIVTCHAPDIAQLKKRTVISRLIKSGAFDNAVFLGTGSMCGRMTSFYRLGDKND